MYISCGSLFLIAIILSLSSHRMKVTEIGLSYPGQYLPILEQYEISIVVASLAAVSALFGLTFDIVEVKVS